MYKLMKYDNNYAKILDITIQNLVPQVTWCPRFVDLCVIGRVPYTVT